MTVELTEREEMERKLACPFCDFDISSPFDLTLGLGLSIMARHTVLHHYSKVKELNDDDMYNKLLESNEWLKGKDIVKTFTFKD